MSGVGPRARLLQVIEGMTCLHDDTPDNRALCSIAFASKNLSNRGFRYSNIEKELLGILHRLEDFHHYSFAHEVNIITDHKSLVPIFKKDISTPSE